MCGGSGSPSGQTKVEWNDAMAPRWNSLLERAGNAGGSVIFDENGNLRPRQSYTGERVAPLNYDQNAAGSNIRSLNDLSTNTIQAGNAGRQSILNTLGGAGLNEGTGNPYMGLQTASMNPYIGGNPYGQQQSATERNVFAGNSPYARDLLNQSLQDTTDAFDRGTRADTTRMMNLSGAFGGSAHQQKMANDDALLAKTLSNQVNQFGQNQYDRSANLEESFLGRDLGAQQYNQNLGANLYENALNRGTQNFNAGLDRGMTGYEGERGRQMQAIGYGQNEQNLALQRAGAQTDYGNLVQQNRQQGNDFNFDQWTQQQNYPFSALDWLAGMYGKSVGSGGMNQSIYQGSGSQLAPYLGAGLGLMSML